VPAKKPARTNVGRPVANASSINSNVRAATSVPLPNATTAATSRRGGEVSNPISTPARNPELTINP
jgi:hypothetical protein